MGSSRRPLRICLAASGGGHVRQLLDMEPAWGAYDHFFVTEDTALGQSIARDHRTHFVSHVAFGQARLGAPVRMALAGLRNIWQSIGVALRERPDVVISTGAGSMFPVVFWSRLMGARVIVIDSFARFEGLSMFARIAGPFAHHRVVQSKALQTAWPDAAVFDPLKILDRSAPPKKPLLFATVGATLPFERLVRIVSELKARGDLPEDVVVQTGVGGAKPDGMHVVETLPFDEVLALQRDAEFVVCHGGTGSLITALREGCKVIAVPRLFELGEHYDDHQAEITSAFRARGLIEVAHSADELGEAIARLRARPAVVATSDPAALIEHLKGILGKMAGRGAGQAAPEAQCT